MVAAVLVVAGLAVSAVAPEIARSDGGDGGGTVEYVDAPVGYASTGNFVDFTLTLDTGEQFVDGGLQITVPDGWSQPSTVMSADGYTTSDCGTVSTAGQVITITGINLSASSCLVTYGDLPGNGVTAPAQAGDHTFPTETRATAGGTFTPVAQSPVVEVTAPDGSGTLTTPTDTVVNGSSGNTVTFTYTADLGGIFQGALLLTVPPGWSPPSDTSGDPGYTTVNISGCGCSPLFLATSGRQIFVGIFALGVLGEPDLFTITYGDLDSGASPGATAPSTGGKQHWPTQEVSNGCSCSSQFRRLSSTPVIRVLSPDGSGSIKATPTAVSANSYKTLTFKYASAPGGTSDGAVSLDVPAGWTQPTTTSGQPGYVTASTGTVSTSGQTITVSNLDLAGKAVTITYGSKANGGPGALAPLTTGPDTWTTSERSSTGGTLTPLSSSPLITVYAEDGSGLLTTPTATVPAGSTGNTIEFTYTADAGGTLNGDVTLTVPPGWSAPSTASGDDGYTTADAGIVKVSGRRITVTGLTLAGIGTVTITYGAGSGATAPSATGPQTWSAKERSTHSGLLSPISTPPTITVA